MYEGRIFDRLEAGVEHARSVGFEQLIARGVAAAEPLPQHLVYAGFSMGVMPAQKLAQIRAGARGALLFEACVPPNVFGCAWPHGVPLQVHGMEGDPSFVDEGDLVAARELVTSASDAELFLYPGDEHLFADDSLPSYDQAAATLLTERVWRFLSGVRRVTV